MYAPSRTAPSISSGPLLVTSTVVTTRSSGHSFFRAVTCMTAVRKACGLKRPEIQVTLGVLRSAVHSTSCLCRSRKSASQGESGARDGEDEEHHHVDNKHYHHHRHRNHHVHNTTITTITTTTIDGGNTTSLATTATSLDEHGLDELRADDTATASLLTEAQAALEAARAEITTLKEQQQHQRHHRHHHDHHDHHDHR